MTFCSVESHRPCGDAIKDNLISFGKLRAQGCTVLGDCLIGVFFDAACYYCTPNNLIQKRISKSKLWPFLMAVVLITS
jgi:hypothetical protein